jgi:hypothetical protein
MYSELKKKKKGEKLIQMHKNGINPRAGDPVGAGPSLCPPVSFVPATMMLQVPMAA